MEEKQMSDGAEKVERTEKAAKKSASKGTQAKKRGEEKTRAAVKEERKLLAEERRAERKAREAERRAALTEREAQRKEERRKRRELLKNETEAQRMKRREREKKERLALLEKRKTERKERALKAKELRLREKEAKLENRKHRREQRTPGVGGWLAAVVSLGVSTLVLATIVTAGAFNMRDMNAAASAGYRSSFYELTGLMDEMETDLSKLRVSSTAAGQRNLATDLLVNSSLAAGALERFPAEWSDASSLTSFINGTRDFSKELLTRLASGNGMTEEDEARAEELYEKQANAKRRLNTLANEMTDGDLRSFLKNGEGKIGEMLHGFDEREQKAEQGAPAETREPSLSPNEDPAREHAGEENVTETAELALGAEISSAKAQEYVRQYFKDYELKTVDFVGETVSRRITCYNFTALDQRDRELFVQISKEGGKLVFFDYYETCTAKNYNVERCEEIAEEFLAGLGLEEMESVFVSESGTSVDFTFVYEQDDVLVYPDLVRVKVCETRGKVVGIEAAEFWNTHRYRAIPAPKLTKAEAKEKAGRLNVEEIELAIIPVNGQETLCYELYGKHGEESYLVYIDAQSGEEAAIYTIVETKQGNILK